MQVQARARLVFLLINNKIAKNLFFIHIIVVYFIILSYISAAANSLYILYKSAEYLTIAQLE